MPKWSNPDYVNELDPKIVDMLVEFHKSQGTLETPEAKAEIAQKKKEIEEGNLWPLIDTDKPLSISITYRLLLEDY